MRTPLNTAIEIQNSFWCGGVLLEIDKYNLYQYMKLHWNESTLKSMHIWSKQPFKALHLNQNSDKCAWWWREQINIWTVNIWRNDLSNKYATIYSHHECSNRIKHTAAVIKLHCKRNSGIYRYLSLSLTFSALTDQILKRKNINIQNRPIVK